MGNYNQVYYTDYRWIKQITEESNKTLEKNKEKNLKYPSSINSIIFN